MNSRLPIVALLLWAGLSWHCRGDGAGTSQGPTGGTGAERVAPDGGAGRGGASGSQAGGASGSDGGLLGTGGRSTESGGGSGVIRGAASTGGGGGGVDAGSATADSGSAGATAGVGGWTGKPCSARTDLRFCDDFEKAGSALTAPWNIQLNGSGTVTIDTSTPAHSGTSSVHVKGGENDFDTLFVLHDTSILPAPSGRFFLRAFMRLGRPMSDKHNTFIIADLAMMPGGGNAIRISEMFGMLMYTVMGDAHGALSNQAYYTDQKPGVVFAPSSWVCLEVLIDHGGPELDVWVDGIEVPDLHHHDFPLDSYDSLRFGFEKYGGPALDIWYDDIAIGTARIGCD